MGLQNFQTGLNNCGWNWSLSTNCDSNGCNTCPDFVIKRHDTRPPLKVQVQECDPTIDWTDTQLVLEVNIWYNAKLKAAVTDEATSLMLADNIGFDQMLVSDTIVMGGPRSPEMMVVTGFDEITKEVLVSRGYNDTEARAWAKGTKMKVFRARNAPASIENVLEDVIQEDGSTEEDQLTGSYLVYEWIASDTCLPGCFMVEYKLMRMMTQLVEGDDREQASDEIILPEGVTLPTETMVPSQVLAEYGCDNGLGVEWVRRFPSDKEAFVVQILDSPTTEL